jgi:hypothetical protein
VRNVCSMQFGMWVYCVKCARLEVFGNMSVYMSIRNT